MGIFVKFTSIYTDEPVMISVDDISSFYKDSVRPPNTTFPRPCTKIFMKNGISYTVDESFETVTKRCQNESRSD